MNSYGGRQKNSLLRVLNAEMNDEEEPVLFENSVYLSLDNVIDVLKTRQNALNVLSLNCQSLFAKYDQLCVYIKCLQDSGCQFDDKRRGWISHLT